MKHATGMEQTEKETYKPYKTYMLTWRNFIHYFRKYQSYGISVSELEKFPDDVTHILILYSEEKYGKVTQYYLSKIEQWKNGLHYDNVLKDGTPDPQKHVPYREMENYKTVDEVPEPI